MSYPPNEPPERPPPSAPAGEVKFVLLVLAVIGLFLAVKFDLIGGSSSEPETPAAAVAVQGVDPRCPGSDREFGQRYSGELVPCAPAIEYARAKVAEFGWATDQFDCLDELWGTYESMFDPWAVTSVWDPNANNGEGVGAMGIPQLLLEAHGHVFALGEWQPQVDWGLEYIKIRYDNPCGALRFELSHIPHWY